MNLLCRLGILLIFLWMKAFFVPGIQCSNGNVSHLSTEDVLLLKDEPNPKCFTRTTKDFICFFETADNRTYDLLYFTDNSKQRCEISVQRTEEGTFLHICLFPKSEVLLFVETHLEVVEPTTNTILYNRTLCVDQHILSDQPFNVSLRPNGQVGQLNILWDTKTPKYSEVKAKYRIQYSSRNLEVEREQAKEDSVLDSLVPGEEVKVQVTSKSSYTAPHTGGHWSSWSHPVRAVVPQSAGDISLTCFTSDLLNVTCHWNGSRYGEENKFKLFYQTGHSEPLRWTNWSECVADENITDLCCFHGGTSRKVRFMLSNTSASISRTFYSHEFTLNSSIKTSPPTHLKRVLKKDKLCLQWEVPLPSLSTHLQYEVDHQLKEEEGWKHFRPEMVKGPKTDACLAVPAGSQYRVRVRAQPVGPIYSGYWSDWSDVLTGKAPSDIGMLLVVCIPISILITATIITTLCSIYISKLKQYFWPPVPNPEKVLRGYLTEINKQKGAPPVLAKQCSEETTTSAVEIMSEEDVSRLGKPSEEFTELLSSEGSFTSSELVDGSPGTEVFPDYVTLNKDSIFLCSQDNTYIYEHVMEKGDPEIGDKYLQTCHCSCTEADGSACVPPCLCNDLLNQSYLPLAESVDEFNCKVTAARSPGNIYTNLP